MSEPIILKKDRVECLVRELKMLLNREDLDSIGIKISEKSIVLVPFPRPVEIKL